MHKIACSVYGLFFIGPMIYKLDGNDFHTLYEFFVIQFNRQPIY